MTARPDQRLKNVAEAAEVAEAARRLLHARVLEARSPDLFNRRCSLRDIAAVTGMAPETVRKLASTPVVPQ